MLPRKWRRIVFLLSTCGFLPGPEFTRFFLPHESTRDSLPVTALKRRTFALNNTRFLSLHLHSIASMPSAPGLRSQVDAGLTLPPSLSVVASGLALEPALASGTATASAGIESVPVGSNVGGGRMLTKAARAARTC